MERRWTEKFNLELAAAKEARAAAERRVIEIELKEKQSAEEIASLLRQKNKWERERADLTSSLALLKDEKSI